MSDPVLDIFAEAVDLAPDERAEYLDRFCAGNAELRRKVESLLTQDDAVGHTFLPLPPPDPRLDRLFDKPDGPDALIGRTVGTYTIRSRIAAGGMGTVYLAAQANPRRDVALKILHGGFGGSALRKRFENEALILALLQHPNIAQVYEAGTATVGTADGHKRRVSFFAMEHVPGATSITGYAQALNLTTRRRLELFADVCEAVHHGHQRGIVHRDLKPANILVDDCGRPKIVDFGVARVTNSDVAVTTMQTDAGQLIGTLAYMSPEQCAADPREIHTPSDVYSLGVVLFELLTGKLPYDVSHLTIHVATRMICEQAPAPPSQFDRRLKGDVETIVLKALEKDRTKRYASAAALADDTRRHLRGEPITARPHTRLTKLLSWVQRRPVLTTALLCGVIAMATTLATYLTVQYLYAEPHRLLTFENSVHRQTGIDFRSADEARLLSRNGNVLATWGGSPGSIHDVSLLDRHSKWGGKIALIGFGLSERLYPGEIVAFDANRPGNTPIWRDKIRTPDDLPSIERKTDDPSRWDFGPCGIWQLDVFPDDQSPGEEIIAVFGHRNSMRCLRIYNQNGNILYDLWHDGPISDLRWLAKSKQLVILGQDDTAKQNIRKSTPGHATGVYVLFSIEPVIHTRNNEVLMSCENFGTVRPAWTRYFHPAVIDLAYNVEFREDTGALGKEDHFCVKVIMKEGPTRAAQLSLEMIVDANGVEEPKSRNYGDSAHDPACDFLRDVSLSDKAPLPPKLAE